MLSVSYYLHQGFYVLTGVGYIDNLRLRLGVVRDKLHKILCMGGLCYQAFV